MSDCPRLGCYILFDTHTDAMALHAHLKRERIPARISPTPHGPGLRAGCGVAILLEPEDLDAAKECIDRIHAAHADIVCLPARINPRRDHFM